MGSQYIQSVDQTNRYLVIQILKIEKHKKFSVLHSCAHALKFSFNILQNWYMLWVKIKRKT